MLTSAAPSLFIFATKLNSAKRKEGATDVNINRITDITDIAEFAKADYLQPEFRLLFL